MERRIDDPEKVKIHKSKDRANLNMRLMDGRSDTHTHNVKNDSSSSKRKQVSFLLRRREEKKRREKRTSLIGRSIISIRACDCERH